MSRCPIHASAADPSNAGVEAAILGHLVRCMDPASTYHQVLYCTVLYCTVLYCTVLYRPPPTTRTQPRAASLW